MYYKDDRNFTDKVHKEIAVPSIYRKLQWFDIRNSTEEEDNNKAIDYFARDINGNIIAVQERFRRLRQAKNFTDFTLRYQRSNENQHFSEFYKMFNTAMNVFHYYMIYGVISDNFILKRFAVLNLNTFYEAIQNKTIVVGENSSIFSKVENNILFAGLGFNKDKSSSFVSFDIKLLKQTVPNIILLSAGF